MTSLLLKHPLQIVSDIQRDVEKGPGGDLQHPDMSSSDMLKGKFSQI